MQLLFADTETTGSSATDRLCQLGFHINGLERCVLYKPPVLIKSSATYVHQITNDMVADKRVFQGSFEHLLFTSLQQTAVFVAHNAQYDLRMLAREGIKFAQVIDTLKVARYLLPAGTSSSHKLQDLRQYYQLDIEAVAHDALGDVRVMKGVFEKMMKRLLELEAGTQQEGIRRMIEITRGTRSSPKQPKWRPAR